MKLMLTKHIAPELDVSFLRVSMRPCYILVCIKHVFGKGCLKQQVLNI